MMSKKNWILNLGFLLCHRFILRINADNYMYIFVGVQDKMKDRLPVLSQGESEYSLHTAETKVLKPLNPASLPVSGIIYVPFFFCLHSEKRILISFQI